MVELKQVRFRNFLSYGNAWTDVVLDDQQLTAIVGKNAAGKTSILSAIVFGLYGKSLSGIPKARLINSINQKQLEVQIMFESNNHEYKVIRGIKPNVFQIYKDDVLINEASDSRDYQTILEDQILHMSYKTFIQTVVVGMSNFTPFMELSTGDRRIIVEDLLGVGVLTTMNILLKERVSQNNQQIYDNDNDYQRLKIELTGDRKVLQTLLDNQKQANESLINQRNEFVKQIDAHQKTIDKLTKSIDKLTPATSKFDTIKSAIDKAVSQQGKVNALIDKIVDDNRFIEHNDSCPLCHQTIDDGYRQSIIDTNKANKDKLDSQLVKVQNTLDKLYDKYNKIVTVINKVNELNQIIRENNATIRTINSQIAAIDRQLNTNVDDQAIVDKQNEIRTKALKGRDLLMNKQQLLQDQAVYNQATDLLKDSGIKTAVIDQYLPIINQMINKYLSDMEFYLSFEFDNQFNETIKARGRDDMTYNNLSQGERRRLDMAIMFTWRYIAQLRNSCHCTNIFVDEVLDSSLDAGGIDSIMKLFRSFDDSHVFVISHRESVQDMEFDKVITIEKRNQYSVISVV